jgi:acylphosphatase
MIRLTAYISGSVQRIGYRAKVVSLANEMGLVGLVQNQPDSRVLVIAEGEKKDDLERFTSAIAIKNSLIDVEDVCAKYTQGSGQYSSFKKVTGSDEVGERLDDGIEILKRMLDRQDKTISILSNVDGKLDQMLDKQDLTISVLSGMDEKLDQTLYKQDQTISILSGIDGKLDQTLDKQDATIGEIRGLRDDLKSYMDMRFKRIEADLAELKEMKAALKEKGLI